MTYDGQRHYDEKIRPFVKQHGERRGPYRLTPMWPPARRDARYYDLADRRLPPRAGWSGQRIT